jgi:hypothetical protein
VRHQGDQGVGTEANEGDGGGCDARTDGDAELDEVPSDLAPRQQARSPLQLRALCRWKDVNLRTGAISKVC